ncbi:MAG: F0F1 ATP synthase subunit alpha, partial [Bacteroidota bacterium]
MSVEKMKEIIKNFQFQFENQEYGEVVSVYDGIALVSGLVDVFLDEVLIFKNSNLKGIVVSMDENLITTMILGDYREITNKSEVIRTKDFFKIGVSNEIIGRVIDGFGNPIDEKGEIKIDEMIEIDAEPIPMIERDAVKSQLVTGIKLVDCLIPVGFGQRQLILGDPNTGKTSIGLTTMISQKDNPNVVSVYVSIGKRIDNVSNLLKNLKENNVKNFVIVRANASDPVSMKILAPMVGCAIGEYFRGKKKHAILIYDDLTSHAVSYRELSLILRKSPGREAYPGNIFYLHAKLLERACQLNKMKGSGSLTALPIIETYNGDISNYIPTNVISITDGQLFLSQELFTEKQRPAIKTGVSVSRVGGECQYNIVKKLVGSTKIEIAQYEEYVEFTKFSSQIKPEIKKILDKGNLIFMALSQNRDPVPIWKQILILYGLK